MYTLKPFKNRKISIKATRVCLCLLLFLQKISKKFYTNKKKDIKNIKNIKKIYDSYVFSKYLKNPIRKYKNIKKIKIIDFSSNIH